MRSQAVFSIAVNAEKQQTQTGVGLSAGPWSTLLRKVTMQSEWDIGKVNGTLVFWSGSCHYFHLLHAYSTWPSTKQPLW